MYFNSFQYQAWAKPPTALSETIFPDKWTPRYPDRIYSRARTVCISEYVRPPFVAEVIQGDKWKPTYPDLFLKAKRAVDFPLAFYTTPPVFGETIFIDKWIPKYPDYIFRRKFLHPALNPYLSWPPSTSPENITRDKWNAIYPDRINRKAPINYGQIAYTVQPPAENVTLDKWLPQYPSYFKKKTNPLGDFATSYISANTPSAADISQCINDVVIAVKKIVQYQRMAMPVFVPAPPPPSGNNTAWFGSGFFAKGYFGI